MFQMRMHPPGSDVPFNGNKMARFVNVDKEFYIMKMDNKLKNLRVKKRLRNRLITRNTKH